MHRHFTDYFVLTLKGLAMGAADVVPGVSGGTIAFISGIYEELLESIDGLHFGFFKTWKLLGFKKAWQSINGSFLLALLLGISISILSLAKLILWLSEHKPILLWSFFFGLVVASAIYIAKQIITWNIIIISALILTTIVSFYITTLKPFASPESNIYLLFCGFIGIIAMILPGVSGAFILLILGAYHTAISTVNDLYASITTLNFELFKDALLKFLMLALGAIVGLKVFSKILNWMFKHYKNLTLAVLTGFMIGSLNKIWPWKKVLSWRTSSKGKEVPLHEESISPFEFGDNNELLAAIILMLIGFLAIVLLERLSFKTKVKL